MCKNTIIMCITLRKRTRISMAPKGIHKNECKYLPNKNAFQQSVYYPLFTVGGLCSGGSLSRGSVWWGSVTETPSPYEQNDRQV